MLQNCQRIKIDVFIVGFSLSTAHLRPELGSAGTMIQLEAGTRKKSLGIFKLVLQLFLFVALVSYSTTLS